MTKREQVHTILSKALSRSKYSYPSWIDEYVEQIMRIFQEPKKRKKDVH